MSRPHFCKPPFPCETCTPETCELVRLRDSVQIMLTELVTLRNTVARNRSVIERLEGEALRDRAKIQTLETIVRLRSVYRNTSQMDEPTGRNSG